MNSLRSTISAYHVHIDGKSVEKQQKVFALLAGIFNQRPPQPRFVVIWDVEIVLQYIRTDWYDNSSLNDADLSCKLTPLLVLTTSVRVSMIYGQSLLLKIRANTYFISASFTKVGGKVRLLQLLPILLLVSIKHCFQWKH